MITEKEVWLKFQKVKQGKREEEISLPKNGDTFVSKLNNESRENLSTLTKYFNTKGQNIDIERYMSVGFSLGKSFSYNKFLDRKVIDNYINRDKSSKRKEATYRDVIKSATFVLNYRNLNLLDYGTSSKDEIHLPIDDYIKGYIDSLFLTFLIEKRYLRTSNYEQELIPYVINNYSSLKSKVNRNRKFFEEMEEIMSSKLDKEKYLEKKDKKKEDVEEQMIYDGETVEEKRKKEKEYKEKQLNEQK